MWTTEGNDDGYEIEEDEEEVGDCFVRIYAEVRVYDCCDEEEAIEQAKERMAAGDFCPNWEYELVY
jgi:F0F1-type ATP synthase gamma subunit